MFRRKKLYQSGIATLDEIRQGLMSILPTIKKEEILAILITVQSQGHSYHITNTLYLENSITSVNRCITIIESRYDLFFIKYHFTNIEKIEIVGRKYLPASEYAEIIDKKVRKQVLGELRKIQERVNQVESPTQNKITDGFQLLRILNDLSQKVSKGVLINTPLYLHNHIYDLQDPSITKTHSIDMTKLDKTLTLEKSIQVKIQKNNTEIHWLDHFYTNGEIHRVYNNNVFFFRNKQILDVSLVYNFPALQKDFRKDTLQEKIGVLDLETYVAPDQNSAIVPYAASCKVAKEIHTFYGTDCVESLLHYIHTNYPNYVFYVHNLDFDGPYLLKALSQVEKKIEKIRVILDQDKKYILIKTETLKILDSFKVLPSSLKQLAKEFQLPIQKIPFPYRFVTQDNLYYEGNKPSIDFYENLTDVEYNQIPTKFHTKVQTMQYVENDVTLLFSIITRIRDILWEQFEVDLTNHPTIASLSYKIYITRFYQSHYNLRNIHGQIAKDIRQAYYGGITQVYRREAKNAFYYDINSQYPSAIRETIPTGNPTFVTRIPKQKPFGFFYVSVVPTETSNLFIPSRTNSKTTIYTTKKFCGWYFSKEIEVMQQRNWKVDIHYGYQFEAKENVFTSFIEKIYAIRIHHHTKGDITIAHVIKLLLNSLYGRIGFVQPTTNTKILRKSDLSKFQVLYTVHEILELNPNYLLVFYDVNINQSLAMHFLGSTLQPNELKTMPISSSFTQSSVPVAAAVAAYARTSIVPYKTIPQNAPIYTDTDSIVLPKEIDPSLVSDLTLGKIKSPIHIEHGIFLAQKVYSLKQKDGTFITKIAGVNNLYLTHKIFEKLAQGEIQEIHGIPVFQSDFSNFQKRLHKKSIILSY